MLTIRQEQFRIFERAEREKFADWMIGHLKAFFPVQCSEAGDGELTELIHYGIERAGLHGFTARRDTCKYIDLMMAFGRNFDEDKRLPWARDTLGNQRNLEDRMNLLFKLAMNHLRRSQ